MIENDLKRIADALEGIQAFIQAGMTKPKVEAPKVEVPPAAKGGIAAFAQPPVAPATPPAPQGAPLAWPSSPEELRVMAQKIAMKMGPKTLEFTAWVTKEIAAYNVTKLNEIPADKVIEMAVKLDAYAKEKGINV
jgi:hypothetical protein